MALCSVNDCNKPGVKRTWCEMHYARWKRHGDPLKVGTKGWKLGMERYTTLHASVHPSIGDIRQAAGFLEGEGCFNWAGGTSRISANQVNYEPVAQLLSYFGGALKHYKKRRAAIHKTQPSPVWDWYVSGSRARGVMMTLYKFMSAKRKEQIRNALR